jgi:hypothetical protein
MSAAPTSTSTSLPNFDASPVKGIAVVEAVGIADPVGVFVVVFAVLFNATHISGTRVAKATPYFDQQLSGLLRRRQKIISF